MWTNSKYTYILSLLSLSLGSPPPHPQGLTALSRAPCVVQPLPTSCLLYVWYCVHVSPTLWMHPTHACLHVSWSCLFVQLPPVLFCVLRALAKLCYWTSSFISAHCVCWLRQSPPSPCWGLETFSRQKARATSGLTWARNQVFCLFAQYSLFPHHLSGIMPIFWCSLFCKSLFHCLLFAYFSCKCKSYHCYFYLAGSRNLFSRALHSLWPSKELTPVSLSHICISDSKLLKVFCFRALFM